MVARNSLVAGLLRSPVHRLLSGSTTLVRYRGRRSGQEIVLPVQYARSGADLIILVGRPHDKVWWRNFATTGEVETLMQRRWVPMTANAVVGTEEPETVAPLLNAYLARFPRAARVLGPEGDEERIHGAVIVRCRPR